MVIVKTENIDPYRAVAIGEAFYYAFKSLSVILKIKG